MIPSISLSRLAAPLALFLAAFLLNAPHLVFGVGDPNFDLFLHYGWARDFAESFQVGSLYPRWVAEARYGLGEPTFLFYSPLYFFLVAVFKEAGLATWTAMQWVEILANTGFAWFIYLTAARFVSARLALLIALAALFNPFLVMLHYKWQGFPWASVGHLATAWLLWALLRQPSRPESVNLHAVPALAVGILSHVVSAMALVIVISAAFLIRSLVDARADGWRSFRPFGGWLLTVAVAVALSGLYLIPALAFKGILAAERAWALGVTMQGFAAPFVTAGIYGTQWFLVQWPVSLMALGLFLTVVVYWFRHRDAFAGRSAQWGLVFWGGAAAALLASELSFPLWLLDTPLNYVVVPYRFVYLLMILSVLALGFVADSAQKRGSRLWQSTAGVALACCVAVGLALEYEANGLKGDDLPRTVLEDRPLFEALRECLLRDGPEAVSARFGECASLGRGSGPYRGVTEYQLPWAADGYEPIGLDWRASVCAPSGIRCGLRERVADGMQWRVELPGANTLVMPLFDFPMWRLSVDGAPVPHRTDPATGLVQIDLDAGVHTVRAEWQRSDAERWGLLLSLITLALLIAWAFHRRLQARR